MSYTAPTTRSTGDLITNTIWNSDLVDNIVYLKNERDTAVQASPVGHLLMWPTNTAPTKFLLCAGQAVSRSTYSALFAVIGTTFGAGDGSTTFNVPDLRGRFPLGKDDMGGSSANRVTAAQADTIGGASGAETHTLASGEIPAHNHGVPTTTAGATAVTKLVNAAANVTSTNVDTVPSINTGGGGAHNNMPPYLTLNFIIYAGV